MAFSPQQPQVVYYVPVMPPQGTYFGQMAPGVAQTPEWNSLPEHYPQPYPLYTKIPNLSITVPQVVSATMPVSVSPFAVMPNLSNTVPSPSVPSGPQTPQITAPHDASVPVPTGRSPGSSGQGLPLQCFACHAIGHKATHCPAHPRPILASSTADAIVMCSLHGKPRTSRNMYFNNSTQQWQCFTETKCRSV